jgi:CHRD domain/PEP-CTERM motif
MTRRSSLWISALALGLILTAGFAAHATVFPYNITLNGPSENPANGSPGVGSATATYDDVAHTLDLQITFSGLVAGTTAAHFHAVTATSGLGGDAAASAVANVGVATTLPFFAGFPTGVTSGTYSAVLDLTDAASWNPAFVTAQGGIAQAEAAFAGALGSGMTYLNIHSSEFPSGEIRGFPVLVPEPATAGLLALGLAAFASRRRRS